MTKRTLRETSMNLIRKENKAGSPEQIGSMGVMGEGRSGEGRKGEEWRKMYSAIIIKKEKHF